jgi:Lar family restriction alleviation protein
MKIRRPRLRKETPMTAPDLLPCPFCGEVPIIKDTGKGISIFLCESSACSGSGMWTGFLSEDRDEAIAAWNRRPPTPLASALDVPEVQALVSELEGWLNIAHHCEITDGCCCCGDDMQNHLDPVGCGHSPVEHGSYVARRMVESTVTALIALKGGSK